MNKQPTTKTNATDEDLAGEFDIALELLNRYGLATEELADLEEASAARDLDRIEDAVRRARKSVGEGCRWCGSDAAVTEFCSNWCEQKGRAI